MEIESKHPTASSHISGFVQRFAKLCRLQSLGVFSDEIPSAGIHSDETEETDLSSSDSEAQKVHPQTSEDPAADPSEPPIVRTLFDAISSLKSAYIQLQAAHIPYDLEKIRAADEAVISNLKLLRNIKKSYQRVKPQVCSSLDFHEEIKKLKRSLAELDLEIQSRDADAFRLRKELEGLEAKNKALEEQLKHKDSQSKSDLLTREMTPNVFLEVFDAAAKSIHEFAKPLIALMKASGWDLDRAAESIDTSVVYLKRAHKKFAFEAYLCNKMFGGERRSLARDFARLSRFEDPFDALVEDPHSDFGVFCRSKYIWVVHPAMERSFFGNLDQRTFARKGGHPRTPLYQVFVKMAKWVWVLRVLCELQDTRAEMFRVMRGSEYSEVCMKSVVDEFMEAAGVESLKVGLMVMPGFRLGKTILKSRVYPMKQREK